MERTRFRRKEHCMAATEPRPAEELGLTIDGVNHLTLPVRDHERAREFAAEDLDVELPRALMVAHGQRQVVYAVNREAELFSGPGFGCCHAMLLSSEPCSFHSTRCGEVRPRRIRRLLDLP